MSLPFDQQVTLTSKTYFPTFTGGSGVVSTFWSANDTWLQGGLSLPFDQQVTLNPNTCPNFRCGGVSALAENSFCSIQELSPPWQRTPSAAFEDVYTIWSASDTDFKNLSSNFHWWGLSPPFDQQVTLTSKTYVWVSPPFDQGVSTFGCLFWSQDVSTFWSASDTDFKNLSSNFHWWGGCLHLLTSSWHWLQTPKFRCPCLLIRVSPPLISTWHWLQKPKFGCLHLLIRVSLTLVSSIFSSGCLCLLINKWHWLQKPMFGCLHLLISKWHWLQKPNIWVSTPFDQGVLTLLFSILLIRVSPPFDQQVTLTSKT